MLNGKVGKVSQFEIFYFSKVKNIEIIHETLFFFSYIKKKKHSIHFIFLYLARVQVEKTPPKSNTTITLPWKATTEVKTVALEEEVVMVKTQEVVVELEEVLQEVVVVGAVVTVVTDVVVLVAELITTLLTISVLMKVVRQE